MNAVIQANIVRDCGGTLVAPDLLSATALKQLLDDHAPGCGSPTRVSGTSGGMMRCGGQLKYLDGRVEQYFCAACTARGVGKQQEDK